MGTAPEYPFRPEPGAGDHAGLTGSTYPTKSAGALGFEPDRLEDGRVQPLMPLSDHLLVDSIWPPCPWSTPPWPRPWPAITSCRMGGARASRRDGPGGSRALWAEIRVRARGATERLPRRRAGRSRCRRPP